ncbi:MULTISPECIES: GGDEF domain-containing protein [unclassified Paenibacillus]|uniref:GGDEF domain-containing protein n=1 Tax=unclassified Paenibacillus TaxID=185978 RepID=UPI000954915D|nr:MULTISPECIES: GGDEF domain-containing protein [unclassified Paenibacillus]ASS64908.1 GGDEF domain-containing protein [Paenibacillus sp. RUD330]SIR01895.1 diguanylate cyclase (GGDEF) domain-containing protein [Paenibacillus sp. RU4X]SIR33225.1 diguanylate cyclase (GGDEF) domain-containing protein [Paenibacillus sp. RU4T]
MTNWMSNPSIGLFASACSLTVLAMMMFMSVRLYRSYRRHPVYRLLIVVLPLLMMLQLLQAAGADGGTSPPLLQLGTRLLGIFAFIIINFVFMKLYSHPAVRLKGAPFFLMALAAALIAGLEIAFNPRLLETSAGAPIPFVGLDFYGILVNFLILLDTRGVELRTKYSVGLMIYFAGDLARVTDRYVFQGSVPMLLLLSRMLPVIYFILLFLLLFEWVVDRLLTTYRSSITDGLTGLYNRKHFHQKAGQMMVRGKGIAVIFGDIDNFKKLNDTHGHHRADGVLKQVAEIMREISQSGGIAGRYGGEELLLAVGAGDKAAEIAELLRRRVEEESIVTMSIGVSYSRSGSTVEEVIREADEAMYRSKTTGKNKVTIVNAPARPGRGKKSGSLKSGKPLDG